MNRSTIAACGLLLAACGPKSTFHDYSTPERATRSFLEAGRVGDSASIRESVVAAERDTDLHIDYGDLGDYSLMLDSLIDDKSAVVIMQTGPVRSPVVCLVEAGEWKVTIRGTLKRMQKALGMGSFEDAPQSAQQSSRPPR